MPTKTPTKTRTKPTTKLKTMPRTTKARTTAKSPAARMSLAEAMSALEKEGSEQTRKIYRRHGAAEPMFGVRFAMLKTLMKRIGVDHDLALALWETGNFDARNLAVKVVDPARISPKDLDRWARSGSARMCEGYVAHLAAESPHGRTRAPAWLAARSEIERSAGWSLVGALAMRDETMPDAWFAERLAEIAKTIHASPNSQRHTMNQTMIAIGCRSAGLRKSASAAAKRIGKVEVDQGDTACKTPDARESMDKAWAVSDAKGLASPAAHERKRESMRTRC